MEDYSLSSFLIANAGLRYLFQEKAFAAVDANSADEYRIFYRLCRDNLETALANLDFILPSNSENIEALLLGVSYPILMTGRNSRTGLKNFEVVCLCR